MSNSISPLSPASASISQLSRQPNTFSLPQTGATAKSEGHSATEVREAFTDFVGQTFFGQMMKAMRSTQGKPAYFHGGRGEEVFQSQLDQTLVESMAEVSADRFSEPLFARQFPRLAAELKLQETRSDSNDLSQLNRLRRQ